MGKTAATPLGKKGHQLPGWRCRRPTAQTTTMTAILMEVSTMLSQAPNSEPRTRVNVRARRRSGAMTLGECEVGRWGCVCISISID